MWVGDRHQAIYGWVGADNDAVDQIVKEFKCAMLPLTVTYRCPKEVVKLVNTLVPDLQSHEAATEGRVTTISDAEFYKKDGWTSHLTADDAILCRKTRPLVETAMALIRRSIPCHVEGRDIGAGLIKLVNRFSARTVSDLLDQIEIFKEIESQKLIAKGKETQAESIRDRCDTVVVLAEGCSSVDEVRVKITSLFKDGENEHKKTLTLSTVHKAKGREWPRVFILGANLFMPSQWARQQWQIDQERNIQYVCYTRAQSELIFIDVTE
jgi:superfamily I DNA/RNA helicase